MNISIHITVKILFILIISRSSSTHKHLKGFNETILINKLENNTIVYK